MTDSNPEEKLRDVVYNGLMPNLHDGWEARDLHRQIANHADQINEAGYGEFFLNVQNAAVSALTLSITKLFERANARYSIRSIPAALALIRIHADSFIDLNIGSGDSDLKRLGVDVKKLAGLSGGEYARAFADALESACPTPAKADTDLSKSLAALRVRRDKTVAHNEVVDTSTMATATWQEAEQLLRFATDALGAIAIVFLRTAVTDDKGNSVFDADSKRAGSQLNRLLQKADVATAI